MNSAITLGTLTLAACAWLACTFHVIAAYVRSPGASVFRPEWKNRYSVEGRRHLRRAMIFGGAALLLSFISFASG